MSLTFKMASEVPIPIFLLVSHFLVEGAEPRISGLLFYGNSTVSAFSSMYSTFRPYQAVPSQVRIMSRLEMTR